jgi:dCMP deaminase
MDYWHEFFFDMARLMSSRSKDPSTRVGCVIVDSSRNVLSTGYNGFPRKVDDSLDRYKDRSLKYEMIVHAEMNAICNATRSSVSLLDSIVYTTYPPCSRCAAHLIQVGIAEINWLSVPSTSIRLVRKDWLKSCRIAIDMFNEVGIFARSYEG